MNKKTVALTDELYISIIETMREGNFIYKDNKGVERVFQPNNRIATALNIEANLGLRIGDVLKLRMSDILKDGTRYRLDIFEEKTKKKREFTVPEEVYNYIRDYAYENNIKPTAKLFDITVRAVQKQLQIVCKHLGIEGVSTHSFRKYFATNIYVNNNYNIELVRKILQHSNTAVTQKYIGIQQKEVEMALQNNVRLI
jgi:integrase